MAIYETRSNQSPAAMPLEERKKCNSPQPASFPQQTTLQTLVTAAE
jgi:hypothetical protein